MRGVTISLSLLCSLFTMLPFVRLPAWWIRIFDFPRLQIAFLCAVSLVLLFKYYSFRKLSNRILISVVAGSFLYQVSLIVKFTPLYPVDAPAARSRKSSFSIMQANVKMSNREIDRFKDLVYKYEPDIVSINETDNWWIKELAVFDSLYPYSIKKPLPNTYGMLLLSKFPLKNKAINFLVQEDIPSFFSTVVLPSGKEFDLHCLHPEPPKPGTSTYERDTEILIVGKRIRTANRPAIVVGDLNDVAWSYTTRRFTEYGEVLDPRQGRGIYNTFSAYIPLLRYPLDHFFYTRHFGLSSLEKLEAFGSDHFPMFISLTFEHPN